MRSLLQLFEIAMLTSRLMTIYHLTNFKVCERHKTPFPLNFKKEDISNKNIVSTVPLYCPGHYFKLGNRKCVVQRSKGGANEMTTEIILNRTLKSGSLFYIGNWAESDCRYDTFLTMLWTVKCRVITENVKITVRAKKSKTSVSAPKRLNKKVHSWISKA